MWCETVGWESPTGSVRSHTHISPFAEATIRENSFTRAGSPSALKTRASRVASASSRGWPPGKQQALDVAGVVVVMAPILHHVLTFVDTWWSLVALMFVDEWRL